MANEEKKFCGIFGEPLRLRGKLPQMYEEIQRAYMEYCRKETKK